MSGESIAILSVGVGLALLLVGLFAWLRSDMGKLEARLDGRITRLEERLEDRVKDLRGEIVETRTEISHLRERMASVEARGANDGVWPAG